MASDAVVTAKDVLGAIVRLRRLGRDRVTSELEELKPELTEQVLEELTSLHSALANLELRTRDVRRLSRRVHALVLVVACALRSGYGRLYSIPNDGAAATDSEGKAGDDTGADVAGAADPPNLGEDDQR